MFKVGLKRRGSILALVVICLVILLVIGAALLTLGWDARIYSIRTAEDIEARCAADTGLTKAIAVMNVNPGYYVNNPPQQQLNFIPLQGSEPAATFRYEVNPLPLPLKYEFLIKSTGRCNYDEASGKYDAQRTVWCRLRLRGLGETQFLSRYSLILKNDTIVDARDSRLPSDDPGQFTLTAQIATDSIVYEPQPPIILYNGVYVDGDVLVGYGGDPCDCIRDLGVEGPYDGKPHMGSLDEEPYLPPVTPPALTDYQPAKLYKKGGGATDNWDPLIITAADSGVYSMIDLQTQAVRTGQPGEGEPAILIVASGDVVLHLTNTGNKDSISLGTGCEIRIMEGATLNLWVDGDISSGTGSGFNNLGTPPDLKLWGLAHDPLSETPLQNWKLNAKNEYFGQVYAPEASVQVNNQSKSGELWGAFTTYDFTMMNSGKLYYDAALSDVNPNDPGVQFVLNRWGEE